MLLLLLLSSYMRRHTWSTKHNWFMRHPGRYNSSTHYKSDLEKLANTVRLSYEVKNQRGLRPV
jgi:hypothetical protein